MESAGRGRKRVFIFGASEGDGNGERHTARAVEHVAPWETTPGLAGRAGASAGPPWMGPALLLGASVVAARAVWREDRGEHDLTSARLPFPFSVKKKSFSEL